MVTRLQKYSEDDTIRKDAIGSVKDRQRDFLPTPRNMANDDDDASFVSVRDRLRKFQSVSKADITQERDRSDFENRNDITEERYNNVMNRFREFKQRQSLASSRRDSGSVASICTNSIYGPATPNQTSQRKKLLSKSVSKARSLTANSPSNSVLDRHCFPPLTVSFQNQEEGSSETDGYQYGDVALKKVEKPIEKRWRKKDANDSAEANLSTDGQSCRLSLSSDVPYGKTDISPSPSSFQSRPLPTGEHSSVNYNRPNALTNRSTSLPTLSRHKSSSPQTRTTGNTIQKGMTATLKKVGPPVEERWKLTKKCEDEVSDTPKPMFASMKLKSISSPANATPTNVSQFAGARQYFNEQTIPNERKAIENHKQEEESTLAKRRRQFDVPTAIDTTAEVSRICYGEIIDGPRSMRSTQSEKPIRGGVSVSDLAKTFSAKTSVSAKDEQSEEKLSPNQPNEIEKIRKSLRSTATELEGIRNCLPSPVAKMIAERNKAAESHGFQHPTGMKNFGPIKSKSLNQLKIPNLEGQRINNEGRSCDPLKGKVVNNKKGDMPKELVNKTCWDPHEGENMFPLSSKSEMANGNRDTSFASNCGRVSPMSDGSSNMHDTFVQANNQMLRSDSTISDYTADSDGDWPIYHGENRFIQFTLSSGGIAERIEPNINFDMPPTTESSDGMSTPSLTDVSKKDKKKGMKKFFFGKNKKRMIDDEAYY